MLDFFRKKRDLCRTADLLYSKVVEQARLPDFYTAFAVPDTLDGRFDLVVLHCFLVLRKLKAEGEGALSQALFDATFEDMDESLREMGVSDLSVGKKVKRMASAFMGRVSVYDQALADREALAGALARNLYRGQPPGQEILLALAAHIQAQDQALALQERERLVAGDVVFIPPVRS